MQIILKGAVAVGVSLLAAAPMFAAEQAVVVSHQKHVEPDAALTAFVDALRRELSAPKLDYARIDGMFASKVRTFQRSLDPLEPWRKTGEIKSNYLASAAGLLVEQAELPDGAKMPDYRPDAARQMLLIISKGTFSWMTQVPNTVCTPPAYKVNAAAVKAFAAAHGSDASNLRFFASEIELKKLPTPAAKTAGKVAAGTLLAFKYDPKLSDDWEKLFASNGVEGYRRSDDGEQLYLSQMHLCFGKFTDGYKITALFSFGL